MDNTKKFREKHSLDFSMIAGKNKSKRKSRKSSLPIIASGDQEHEQNIKLPQRVFLYLQPKSISYPSDHVPSERVEIELEHEKNKITALNDHYMPCNIIHVDQLNIEKPTFSVTIEQDSIEDVTDLSDAPIVLTLYVIKLRRSRDSETNSGTKIKGDEEKENNEVFIEERIPVAQGYIDIMEHFNKIRSQSSDTIYLYPLETSTNALTCKIEWEIYSLHPLLKNLVFSNVVFITLGSLYNINDYLINDCNDLVANLSFITKIPNENNEYDKIFICKFTAFSKSTISEQNLSKKWENLKNKELNNLQSMGIVSESKLNLNKLFSNILTTENVDFRLDDINIKEDFALICNSMHRYFLTNTMQKTLEDTLSNDQYQIIMEIYSERDMNKILLQGFIDLSIFLYPEVRYCSYVTELRSPGGYKPNILSTPKGTPKSSKNKKKYKSFLGSGEPSIIEDKIPFAFLQICVNEPITNFTHDMTELSKHDLKSNKYGQCSLEKNTKAPKTTLNIIFAENYKAFDDLVSEILDHLIRNNIKTINDDKEFVCSQFGNMTNRIMKLVACDFNIRTPTKTNIEFTNLMTTVYRELVDRTYECIKKCSINCIENCVITVTEAQKIIVARMSLAKYMYEVGNMEWAEFFMDKLRNEYPNNPILNFYIFLCNMERQNFQLAKEYLENPLGDKNVEDQLFIDIIHIYLNYKLELQHPAQTETAEENLIKALTEYCSYYPKFLTVWILLYCLYKKHNYRPGMSYTRCKYENLYNNIFFKLENIPKSRWEIYMPYKIDVKSVKGQNYIKVLEQMLHLGLYEFAEWVFEEMANECMEVEKYFIYNTFKIISNNLDKKFSTKDFPVEKLLNPLHLRATLSQVNGNLEYFRYPSSPASMKHYNAIININELDIYHNYQLGILRFAYHMMEEKQYEEAGKAFLYCCGEQVNCIVAAVGRGKACYHLGQLEEAEKYFALSTKYDIYMPNTWAYLALINLRRGNNYNALECWKYARLNPEKDVNAEILNELNKINPSEVFLYVDVPNIS